MRRAWHWTPLVLPPLTGLPRGYGDGGVGGVGGGYLWLFLKTLGCF